LFAGIDTLGRIPSYHYLDVDHYVAGCFVADGNQNDRYLEVCRGLPWSGVMQRCPGREARRELLYGKMSW
jgi:hypothetical protein